MGRLKHLPPTLMARYHFDASSDKRTDVFSGTTNLDTFKIDPLLAEVELGWRF